NSLPNCSFYKWLFAITSQSSSHVSYNFIRGHTASTSLPTQANAAVNTRASTSHSDLFPPPSMPLPTFFMDDYTPYLSMGFVESNFSSHLQFQLVNLHLQDQTFSPRNLLVHVLYDQCPPPAYPYTRSSSAYSAVVQLYIRSRQLDTCHLWDGRFGNTQPWCQFSCPELETSHHIFVNCVKFHALIQSTITKIMHDTKTILNAFHLPDHKHSLIMHVATNLFRDGSHWPLSRSLYYCGLLPNIADLIDHSHLHISSIIQNHLHHQLAHLWHITSIHLTGRIWGFVHQSSKVHKEQPALSLPSHLSHLLPTSLSNPTI
ncbi:hypothetical protein L208DRAFT_1247501, partial [Tricholoma matsutake]